MTRWYLLSLLLACAGCSGGTTRYTPLGDEPPPPLTMSRWPLLDCEIQQEGFDAGESTAFCEDVFAAWNEAGTDVGTYAWGANEPPPIPSDGGADARKE